MVMATPVASVSGMRPKSRVLGLRTMSLVVACSLILMGRVRGCPGTLTCSGISNESCKKTLHSLLCIYVQAHRRQSMHPAQALLRCNLTTELYM